MGKPDRLYGAPYAEQLYPDPAGAYEAQIEPHLERYGALVDHEAKATIEEWTVADQRQFLPSPDTVLEDLCERVADDAVHEYMYERLENIVGTEEIVQAVEAVLALIASKIDFWMAEKHVATHTITWDETGPLIDGEPLYRKSADV